MTYEFANSNCTWTICVAYSHISQEISTIRHSGNIVLSTWTIRELVSLNCWEHLTYISDWNRKINLKFGKFIVLFSTNPTIHYIVVLWFKNKNYSAETSGLKLLLKVLSLFWVGMNKYYNFEGETKTENSERQTVLL